MSYWGDPQRAKRAGRAAVLGVIKASRGCSLCARETDPRMLEFAHIRGRKRFAVNAHSVGRPLDAIVEELRKCVVLCVRCHKTVDAHRLAGLARLRLSADEVRATMVASGAWPDGPKRTKPKE